MQIRYNEDIVYNEVCERLSQIALRGGRSPIPGNFQSQFRWGSGQTDLVEDVPAYYRGFGLNDF